MRLYQSHARQGRDLLGSGMGSYHVSGPVQIQSNSVWWEKPMSRGGSAWLKRGSREVGVGIYGDPFFFFNSNCDGWKWGVMVKQRMMWTNDRNTREILVCGDGGTDEPREGDKSQQKQSLFISTIRSWLANERNQPPPSILFIYLFIFVTSKRKKKSIYIKIF